MVFKMPPALVLPAESGAETGGHDPVPPSPPAEDSAAEPEAGTAPVMPTTRAQASELRARLAALEARASQPTVTRKVKTGSIPPTALGLMATVSVTWDTPFTDTDYDVTVTYQGATGVQLSQPIVNATTTGVTIRLYALAILSTAVPIKVSGVKYG